MIPDPVKVVLDCLAIYVTARKIVPECIYHKTVITDPEVMPCVFQTHFILMFVNNCSFGKPKQGDPPMP